MQYIKLIEYIKKRISKIEEAIKNDSLKTKAIKNVDIKTYRFLKPLHDSEMKTNKELVKELNKIVEFGEKL